MGSAQQVLYTASAELLTDLLVFVIFVKCLKKLNRQFIVPHPVIAFGQINVINPVIVFRMGFFENVQQVFVMLDCRRDFLGVEIQESQVAVIKLHLRGIGSKMKACNFMAPLIGFYRQLILFSASVNVCGIIEPHDIVEMCVPKLFLQFGQQQVIVFQCDLSVLRLYQLIDMCEFLVPVLGKGECRYDQHPTEKTSFETHRPDF